MFEGLRFFQEKNKADTLSRKLYTVNKRLKEISSELEDIEIPKYNGWFILLKKDTKSKCGYEFLNFFNPDISDDEPEWDYAIPIQSKDSIPEFTGW